MSQAAGFSNNNSILSTLTIQTDSGTASPSASILQVLGGTNVTTSAAGNIVLIDATGGGSVTSVSGTAGRITSTGGTTPVIDIDTSYVGQSSITTIGTVTTGVWNATPISLVSSVSGNLSVSHLNSGTSASATTFWRGDGTWATPPGTGVTSVSGTLNRITSTGGTTPIIDISASYVGQSSITTLGTIGTGTWNATTIATTVGGTGLTSYSQGDIIYGSAANTLSQLAKDTNATRYLSNTGASNNPAWAQVDLSNGVTGNLGVTHLDSGTSASSSTFWRGDATWATPASSGGLTWSVITADQSITVNNGYICNKSGLLTLTLPASGSIGDLFEVTGINTDLGWAIAQNANQQIFFGNQSTTVGVTGSLASTLKRDSIRAVCVVAGASTVWNIISSIGNITVV